MLWDKYRHESKQTICIIGVLILAAKLCKADGHFTKIEEEEILKIIPHEKEQKNILLRILEEGAKDTQPIEYHAERIKKYVGDQKSFLEFIVAFLYRLAHSDHVYSEEEEIPEHLKTKEGYSKEDGFVFYSVVHWQIWHGLFFLLMTS